MKTRLVVAAVVLLAVLVVAPVFGDTIKLRDYTGITGVGLDVADPTWTNVRVDDVAIVGAAGSYAYNNFGGGGMSAGVAWDSMYGHVALIGIKNLTTTILPKVNGSGDVLSITSAKLVLSTTRGITGDYTVARVTSNWMLQAAGLSQGTGKQDDGISPEDGITGADLGDGSTPWTAGVWAAGSWSAADYSGTDQNTTGIATVDWFPTMELDATKALQGIYDSGVNYGICVIAPNVLDSAGGIDPAIMSNEANQAPDWSGNPYAAGRPGLIIEYTYVASGNGDVPEPGTLMLLGTGALSLLGYARRRMVK